MTRTSILSANGALRGGRSSPGLQLRQTRDAVKTTYVFFVVPNEWLYHLCPMSGIVSEGPMSGPFYVIAQ